MKTLTAKKGRISVAQLISALFISRFLLNLSYSSKLSNLTEEWTLLIPSIIAIPLSLLMAVPVYFLYKRNKSQNIIDNSRASFGVFGKYCAGIVFILFFLLVICRSISTFDYFKSNIEYI